MNCHNFRKYCGVLFDVEPASQYDKALKDHMRECHTCADFFHEMREVSESLQSPIPFVESESLTRRIMQKALSESSPESNEKRLIRPSVWKLTWATSTGIMVVVAIAVLWLVYGNHNVYAQVREALLKARTLHVVLATEVEGRPTNSLEAWYQQGSGIVEETRSGQEITRRIDDGTYQWKYSSRDNTVVKTDSTNLKGIVEEILSMDVFRENDFKNAAEDNRNDRVIDGNSCRAFIKPLSTNGGHFIFWLDAGNRLRRWEISMDGRDESKVGTVEYDVSIDSSRFAPDFGPNAKLVEKVMPWNGLLSLNNALFTREEMGHVFAVHKAERIKGGFVYLVCSIRPTEETILALGPCLRHGDEYGNFDIDALWRNDRQGEEYLDELLLAHLSRSGAKVQWKLLIPKGTLPATTNQLDIDVTMMADNKLKERLATAGSPSMKQLRPMAKLTLTETTDSTETIITEVYKTALALEPTAWNMTLMLAPTSWPGEMSGRKHPGVSAPGKITVDKYKAEIQESLTLLLGPQATHYRNSIGQ